jgi:hypothetical protein
MEPRHSTETVLTETRAISITDCLFPSHLNDQPWYMELPDNPFYWVPVFSTQEQLFAWTTEVGIQIHEFKIKQIQDGREFLDSIEEGGLGLIRVALNPYLVRDRNVTRWTEVL